MARYAANSVLYPDQANAPSEVNWVSNKMSFRFSANMAKIELGTGRSITKIAEIGEKGLFALQLECRLDDARIDPSQGQSVFDPVMAAPVFSQPIYETLRSLSQEWLFPGAGAIPQDTVCLLETNPKFVESFMVGLNHRWHISNCSGVNILQPARHLFSSVLGCAWPGNAG